MVDQKTQSDLLARAGVVLGSLIVLIISYVQTNVKTADRFTGAQGAVLQQRISHLEDEVETLPPEWLKRDLNKIEIRLERVEAHLEKHQ